MKVEFRVIEIEKLLVTYFGILIILLIVDQFFFHFHTRYFSLHFLSIIPLYQVFSGKISIQFCEKALKITWIKKPFLVKLKSRKVPFYKIIRWKYESSQLGADNFLLILESGKKIRLCPSFFNTKDLETRIFNNLQQKISNYHAETPKEVLVEKIAFSGYLTLLSKKMEWNKKLLYFLASIGLALLLFGSLLNVPLIWIGFILILLSFLFINFRYQYLKSEMMDSLLQE